MPNGLSHSFIGKILIFQAFNWTDVVNIYDTAHYGSTNTGRDLQVLNYLDNIDLEIMK